MKRVFLLALAGSLLATSAPAAGKNKHKRPKEKSFEPVASAAVGGYTGRYVGIESSYWVDVREESDGRLEVTLYEAGKRMPLRDVVLTGSHLEAIKVPEKGPESPFEATFGERRVYDDKAFGLLVEGDIWIDDDVRFNRLFFVRKQ